MLDAQTKYCGPRILEASSIAVRLWDARVQSEEESERGLREIPDERQDIEHGSLLLLIFNEPSSGEYRREIGGRNARRSW